MSDMRLPEVYFLHMPKTAGITLTTLITRNYPRELVIPAYEWHDLTILQREQINNYRCFTGHFGTGLFSLLDRPIPTVTILRDPLERSVSEIFHAHRKESKMVQSILHFITGLWNLPPAISKLMEEGCWLNDMQTRILGVDVDLNPYLGKRIKTIEGYLYVLNRAEKGLSKDRIFENAKRRLDQCAVVGTVERMSDTVNDVCNYLGIEMPVDIPRLNFNPERALEKPYRGSPMLSRRQADFIDRVTEYDRELYAYANHLMDARRAAAIPNKTAGTKSSYSVTSTVK